MPITKKNENTRATVSFIIDGEEQDTPVLFGADYSFQGQKIFPERAVADWFRQDGTWFLSTVKVTGAVQTKSGARGKTATQRRAYDGSMFRPGEGSWSDDTPDWLMVAVMNGEPA